MCSLYKRLAALEERHTADQGAYAAGVEKFHTKMLDLIERSEGMTPDPATMPHVEQMACLMWSDPEEAIAQIKAAAQAAREGQYAARGR